MRGSRKSLDRVGATKNFKHMKNVIKTTGLMTLVVMALFALSSFSPSLSAMKGEKACTVTIKYQNGDPADYVTVTAGYSSGQHDFKTDGKGVVKLTWEIHSIKCLYIKGDKYEVDYSDGKSYSLTLKKKHKYD